MYLINQEKGTKKYIRRARLYSNPFCTQYLLLLARCTHQSMPIMMTLSPELRVPMPTVGGILLPRINTSTVMAHNLN